MTSELQLVQEAQKVLNKAYFWMDFLSLAHGLCVVVCAVFTGLFLWKLGQFLRQRRKDQPSPREVAGLTGLADVSG